MQPAFGYDTNKHSSGQARVSLSDPHIHYDNCLHTGNNGISKSMYRLTRLCCTQVPEIYVRPEMLCVLQYIDSDPCV